MRRVSSKHTVNLPYFAAVQFLTFSSPHLTLSHHCALTLALCRSLSLSLCLLHLTISFVCKLHPQSVQVGCNCTRQSQSRAHPSHTHTHNESERGVRESRRARAATTETGVRIGESTTGRAQLSTAKFVHAERKEAQREWDRARERASERGERTVGGKGVCECCAVGLVVRSFYWVKVIAGLLTTALLRCCCVLYLVYLFCFVVSFRFVCRSPRCCHCCCSRFRMCFAGDRFDSMLGMRLRLDFVMGHSLWRVMALSLLELTQLLCR